MSAALLSVESLDVRYGAIHALRGVSFEARAGEIVTLIGSNGAGKSTLLRAVSGLVRPSAGRIRLEGVDITAHRPESIVALGCSHVPEGRRIFANLTVLENLQMGAWPRRGVQAESLERVFALFPRLREGGIYAAEDLQTSYWPSYGGSLDLDAPQTSMAFFKRLADGLNHAEWIRPGYEPGFLDLNVASVHFYHNMVFVYRGKNDDESNILRANVPPPWLVGG